MLGSPKSGSPGSDAHGLMLNTSQRHNDLASEGKEGSPVPAQPPSRFSGLSPIVAVLLVQFLVYFIVFAVPQPFNTEVNESMRTLEDGIEAHCAGLYATGSNADRIVEGKVAAAPSSSSKSNRSLSAKAAVPVVRSTLIEQLVRVAQAVESAWNDASVRMNEVFGLACGDMFRIVSDAGSRVTTPSSLNWTAVLAATSDSFVTSARGLDSEISRSGLQTGEVSIATLFDVDSSSSSSGATFSGFGLGTVLQLDLQSSVSTILNLSATAWYSSLANSGRSPVVGGPSGSFDDWRNIVFPSTKITEQFSTIVGGTSVKLGCTVKGAYGDVTPNAGVRLVLSRLLSQLHLDMTDSAFTLGFAADSGLSLAADLTADFIQRQRISKGICLLSGRSGLVLDCTSQSSSLLFSEEAGGYLVEQWHILENLTAWLVYSPALRGWVTALTPVAATPLQLFGVPSRCFGPSCDTYIASHTASTILLAIVYVIIAMFAVYSWRSTMRWLIALSQNYDMFAEANPQPLADTVSKMKGSLLFAEIDSLVQQTKSAATRLINYKAFYKGGRGDVTNLGSGPTVNPNEPKGSIPTYDTFRLDPTGSSGMLFGAPPSEGPLIEMFPDGNRDSVTGAAGGHHPSGEMNEHPFSAESSPSGSPKTNNHMSPQSSGPFFLGTPPSLGIQIPSRPPSSSSHASPKDRASPDFLSSGASITDPLHLAAPEAAILSSYVAFPRTPRASGDSTTLVPNVAMASFSLTSASSSYRRPTRLLPQPPLSHNNSSTTFGGEQSLHLPPLQPGDGLIKKVSALSQDSLARHDSSAKYNNSSGSRPAGGGFNASTTDPLPLYRPALELPRFSLSEVNGLPKYEYPRGSISLPADGGGHRGSFLGGGSSLPPGMRNLGAAGVLQSPAMDAIHLDQGTRSTTFAKKHSSFICVKLHDLTKSVSVSAKSVFEVSQLFLETVLLCADQFNGDVQFMSVDRVIISWNALGPYPFHEIRACLCALHLAVAMGEFPHHVNWTMAITSGPVVVGTVGNQRNRTMMINGDPFFVGSILCDVANLLRASIVMTEAVYTMARTQLWCLPIDVIELSGITSTLYELRGRVHDAVNMETYYIGFSELCSAKYDRAVHYFSEALRKTNRNDRQCFRLMQRAKELQMLKQQVQGGQGPTYSRMAPTWIIHEHASESVELPLEAVRVIRSRNSSSVLSGGGPQSRTSSNASTSQQEYVPGPTNERRQSLSPDVLLRAELEELSQSRSSLNLADTMNEKDSDTESDVMMIKDRKNRIWQRSEKVVGRGTFGEVYVGLASDGSLCAIKLLNLPQLDDLPDTSPNGSLTSPTKVPGFPKEVEDLITEVGLLAQLRHECITGYLSSAIVKGPQNPQLAIIMEYISGGPVSKIVGTFGRITPSCVRRYCKDVLRGLQFLHSRDILHRDISPNNILLTIDGRCKLTDFGCATTLQKLKGVVGTPAYMAPEACRGAPGKYSDIWSLGIVAFYMLTGTIPYQQEELQPVEAFIKKLGSDTSFGPNFSILINSASDEGAMKFINSCVSRDPSTRLTADQLLMHPFLI